MKKTYKYIIPCNNSYCLGVTEKETSYVFDVINDKGEVLEENISDYSEAKSELLRLVNENDLEI